MKKQEFINFLQDTLIPDLKESGTTATAEDFETAVRHMQHDDLKIFDLKTEVTRLRRTIATIYVRTMESPESTDDASELARMETTEKERREAFREMKAEQKLNQSSEKGAKK